MKGVCPDGVYGVLAGYPNVPGVPETIQHSKQLNDEWQCVIVYLTREIFVQTKKTERVYRYS